MAERGFLKSKKRICAFVAGALLILVGVAWLERKPLLVSYSIHWLINASDRAQQTWVERVAGLEQEALPKLIDCLRRDNVRVCSRAGAGLLGMVQQWESTDVRRAKLSDCLAQHFAILSVPGQQIALDIQRTLLLQPTLRDGPAPEFLPPIIRLLAGASRSADSDVHARALALVGLIPGSPKAEFVSACTELIRTCMGDKAVVNRMRAIELALRQDMGLLEAVVPSLDDSAPEVRRAAMRALASNPSVLNTDDLLRWLHDPDLEVRTLCEKALRGRGLRGPHIKLGRLMTDSRPAVRLQVFDLLRQVDDLEPGVWLRHLSHDPTPAIRAAAVRAAAQPAVSRLTDRLEQMAQNDPSVSVRQLAQYYLTSRESGSADRREQ
jgi:HEAT repeat protein